MLPRRVSDQQPPLRASHGYLQPEGEGKSPGSADDVASPDDPSPRRSAAGTLFLNPRHVERVTLFRSTKE